MYARAVPLEVLLGSQTVHRGMSIAEMCRGRELPSLRQAHRKSASEIRLPGSLHRLQHRLPTHHARMTVLGDEQNRHVRLTLAKSQYRLSESIEFATRRLLLVQ